MDLSSTTLCKSVMIAMLSTVALHCGRKQNFSNKMFHQHQTPTFNKELLDMCTCEHFVLTHIKFRGRPAWWGRAHTLPGNMNTLPGSVLAPRGNALALPGNNLAPHQGLQRCKIARLEGLQGCQLQVYASQPDGRWSGHRSTTVPALGHRELT
jgi:hypothetical protein